MSIVKRMNYNTLCDLVHDALPGRGIWFQSASDPEEIHQEGLAIRQVFHAPETSAKSGNEGHYYVVCYFRVVPEEGQLDIHGDVIDSHMPESWRVEIGYQNQVDTPRKARREARDLVRYLPRPEFIKDDDRNESLFEFIDELLADAEADAREKHGA